MENRNNEVLEKIQKLLALAGNNPSQAEAKAAMLKAQELMLKYHIENPETVEDDKVINVFYDLGNRKKTEFVLMISVVVANNFRSKTVHHGQRVYFIGFDADAKAAMEVFVYLLNFGDASHQKYFMSRMLTPQDDRDWRYGYIVGIHQAFNSRKGYELMLQVPQKVLEVFNSLNRTQDGKNMPKNNPQKIQGAFTDGFRRGKESMDKREIEAYA